MRASLLPILLAVLGLAASAAAAAPAPKPGAVVGCASLANFRLLMREASDDVRIVTARLADDRAEHLGCALIAPERATAIADRVTLAGQDYTCVSLTGTSVCHWTFAGGLVPALAPVPPKARAPEPTVKPHPPAAKRPSGN